MATREDLGLGLSLGSTAAADDGTVPRVPSLLQLNLMPVASTGPAMPHPFFLHQKLPWSDLVSSSSENRCSTTEPARPFLKGIDVNRVPVAEERDAEDDAGASSSPNSTVSSVSAGKRSAMLRDAAAVDSEAERAYSGGGAGSGGTPGSDDEDGGEGSRKKLRLSKDQSAVLEESFKEHNTLNPKQKLALAKQLNLRPRQVEVWFQNRRARTKLKQTEVDCEILKRCCENLTEENRRLQKEVQELRALKLSPQFYMHMTPPTTLTMCPSCERVAVSSNTAAAPASAAAGSAAASAAVAATAGAEGQGHHRGAPGQIPFPFAHPQPQQAPSVSAQTQMHPFFHHHHQHHRAPMAAGGMAALPWPPMPLRTGAFLDGQAQRS